MGALGRRRRAGRLSAPRVVPVRATSPGRDLGLTEAVWLFALLAVPLYFNTRSARIFEADKATLVRCLALAALALLALTPRPRLASGGPLAIPVLVLLGSTALSTLTSIDPRVSLLGSYHRLQGFGTLLAYGVLRGVVGVTIRKRAPVESAVHV